MKHVSTLRSTECNLSRELIDIIFDDGVGSIRKKQNKNVALKFSFSSLSLSIFFGPQELGTLVVYNKKAVSIQL